MNTKNSSDNNKIKGSKGTTPNVFDVIEKNESLLESCSKIINDLEEWNSYLRSLHEQNSHLYLREIKIHEPPSDPLERMRNRKTIDPLPVTLEELNYDFKYGEFPILPDKVIKERNSKNIQHYKRVQLNSKPDPNLEINQIKITEPNSFSAVPNPPSTRRKNPRNRRFNNIDQMYEHLNGKSPRNSHRISVHKVPASNKTKNQNQINDFEANNNRTKFEFPSLQLNLLNNKNNENIDNHSESDANYYNFDICNHDSSDSLARKKRKLRLQKKSIQTAQSFRRDRSISVPHKLHAMEYKSQSSRNRFPSCQSITDHNETKKKIEKLEVKFQETMEKAVRHIQKLNRQMDKKYGTKDYDMDYMYI